MTDNKNPFGNFSFEDLFKQVQDNPMLKAWQDSDLFKNFTDQSQSNFDVKAIWDNQMKNLDNLNAVNSKVGENVKELAMKQASMMGEAWQTLSDYTKNVGEDAGQDVDANIKKAQGVFEKATANLQELSQRGMEMSGDMAEDMQKRMSESVNDLQDLIKKYQGK